MTDTNSHDFYQMLIDNLYSILDATDFVVEKQMGDISHKESLTQLPFRGNCANWNLGHIVNGRDRMLALLGQDALLSEDEAGLYQSGSEPITTDSESMNFDRLKSLLTQGSEKIKAFIDDVGSDYMMEVINEERGITRLKQILGLAWHESYHSGIFEVYRQAAGKNDKIF